MPNIQGLTGTDTFETWFNRTNEVINTINSSAFGPTGPIRMVIDYSGNIAGQPITAVATSINSPGYTLTVGEPVFMFTSYATPQNDIDSGILTLIDPYHCNMFGRVNGATGIFIGSFTSPRDGWNGAANSPLQKHLYGIYSKIIENDTVNKRCTVEIARPGESFDIKYTDLLTPTNRIGTRYYRQNIQYGGRFFLGVTGSEGIFVHHHFFDGIDSLADGTDYLVITPYNDSNKTLNIYVHPLASRQKEIEIKGITEAVQQGSRAVVNISDLTKEPQDLSQGNPTYRLINFPYVSGVAKNVDWISIPPVNSPTSCKLRVFTVKLDDYSASNSSNNTLIFVQDVNEPNSRSLISVNNGNWNEAEYTSPSADYVYAVNYFNIVFGLSGECKVLNKLQPTSGLNPKLHVNEIG